MFPMPRYALRSAAALMVASTLFACGGGGGGGSGDTVQPAPPPAPAPPPPNVMAPLTVTSANAQGAAIVGLGYGAIALGGGKMAVDWIERAERSAASPFTDACGNGGSATATLADRDGDRRAGAGDQVTVIFTGCYVKELDDSFSGTVTIQLTAPAASQQRAGTVTFAGFGATTGDGRQDLAGTLRFAYSSNRLSKLFHVYSDAQPFQSTLSDGTRSFTDAVTALDVQHEARLDTARTTTSMRFHVASALLGGTLDVSTTTPWGAWFDSYPDRGELSIAGANGSKAGLRASPRNDQFDILLGSSVITGLSAEGTEMMWTGAPWVPQSGSGARYVSQLSSTVGFRQLIQPAASEKLLPNGSLLWAYSRPLDPFSITKAVFVQTSSKRGNAYVNVPAKITVEGAILTVTPTTQLELGAGYRLLFSDSIHATMGNTAGQSLPVPEFSGEVAETVKASLTAGAPALLYGTDATLALDASASSANGAAVSSIVWRQLSGPALTLAGANGPRVTLSPASASNGVAVVELEVANATGDIDRQQISVKVVADISQAFLISYRTGNGPLTIFSSVNLASADGYVRSFSSNTVLDVIAHETATMRFLIGLAAGQTLRAGLKLDYGTGNASGVSGPGWIGCAGSTGSFSILDYAVDDAGNVLRLALDFDDLCGGAATQGSIRYRSTMAPRQ